MPRHPGHLVVAGRYVVLERVGSGATGSVHRAWDRRERREVAVKLVDRPSGEPLLRFVREQSLRVPHPHVLAPHGWAADDDQVLLAMRLVRGGTVADLRRRGPLPEAYVAALLAQLLAALAALHAVGVVHRDVKPANLLLEPTGRERPHLLLADLGIAAVPAADPLTRVPGLIGTDGWLAPECLGGAPPDPRQDLWAAGVVARRLLADPPRRLTPVLGALTADDPARRTSSARAALDLLGACVDLDAPWDAASAPAVVDVLTPPRMTLASRAASACLVGAGVLSVAATGVLLWP